MASQHTLTRKKNIREDRLKRGLCAKCGMNPHRHNRTLCGPCGDRERVNARILRNGPDAITPESGSVWDVPETELGRWIKVAEYDLAVGA